MATAPLINGRRYSFSSIEVAMTVLGGSSELFLDISEINYSEVLNVSMVNGTSRNPIGWTSGMYEPQQGSIVIGKSSFQEMIQKIGPGWLGVNLVIAISYQDIGEILTVDTLACRLVGVEDSHSYGPDALTTTLTILPFYITRNGLPPTIPNRVI